MDQTNLPDEKSFRFLAVLNKKVETGKLMNALGHMTAGLAGKVGNSREMCFLEYKDKDGGLIREFPTSRLLSLPPTTPTKSELSATKLSLAISLSPISPAL